MKKVLVTGAAGIIGRKVIGYLLSEGKYEITALDLRNKSSQKVLKKYRRRINIIYGDMLDNVLIDALVKDQDYIIHLAGVMPPIADIRKNLADKIEYTGTENIIKAINFYNAKCHLFYASSTTVYGRGDSAQVKSKNILSSLDYYSNMKLKTEELIQEKLKNYTIIRVPLVLSNPKDKKLMYNVRKNAQVEAITDNDVAYLFVSALEKISKINRKIFNAGGGDAMRGRYGDILREILKVYGLSFRYLNTLLFVDKNYYTHYYVDSDILNDILEYRSESLSSYYMRLKREIHGRFLARILAKPFILFLRGKNK